MDDIERADANNFVVQAELGHGPIWRTVDEARALESVDVASLTLSDRLLAAFADWADFYNEIQGDLTDPDLAEEFVGQGFKLAHRLRAELKGSTVHLTHPVTRQLVKIVRQTPR